MGTAERVRVFYRLDPWRRVLTWVQVGNRPPVLVANWVKPFPRERAIERAYRYWLEVIMGIEDAKTEAEVHDGAW